jgi:hypothetical protein
MGINRLGKADGSHLEAGARGFYKLTEAWSATAYPEPAP